MGLLSPWPLDGSLVPGVSVHTATVAAVNESLRTLWHCLDDPLLASPANASIGNKVQKGATYFLTDAYDYCDRRAFISLKCQIQL